MAERRKKSKHGGARPNTGGKRRGAGRKRTVHGGREWIRSVVDDPKRRAKFVAAIDVALKDGDPLPYLRAFEHGYGRAPQALDVKVSGDQDKPIVYRAVLEGEDSTFGAPEGADVSSPDVPVGGTD